MATSAPASPVPTRPPSSPLPATSCAASSRRRAAPSETARGRMLLILAKRLLWAVPSAILITALLFFSVAGLLGSPAALMLGQDATPGSIAELNARLGFDRPLLTQYLEWMGRALQGDLGRS